MTIILRQLVSFLILSKVTNNHVQFFIFLVKKAKPDEIKSRIEAQYDDFKKNDSEDVKTNLLEEYLRNHPGRNIFDDILENIVFPTLPTVIKMPEK